jgi:hypothetical protein
MNFDIYTTGGIEFLSQVYKGVIMTFGDSSYETLLRLFGLFTIIFASIALIGKQQIDYLAKRVAILFLISGFAFGLRANVTIIDTKHNQTYVVSGAPWIPAYIHSLFSSMSYQLTNVAQQVFHTGTVNVYDAAATGKNAWGSVNLDYNKTGFGGFFEYLNFFKNYRFNTTGITDLDRIYRKFHIVLTECTINEIPLWPDNDFQKKVLLSNNLIQDLRPTVSGYVEFDGQAGDCIGLYDQAVDDWNTIKSRFNAGDPTLNLLAKLGITAMDSQTVPEANAEILQQGVAQLSDMIGQGGMIWALSDAWDSFLADQSPERAMVYKYELGRNIEESKQMGRSLGLYAKETVPLMKIVFESMTIAFIPITFLIILVSGGNVIRNSIFSFAWVYAWDPVLATINGIVNIAAIAKVKAALNAAAVYNNALNGEWMAYSIQALNIMYSTLDYIPSVAGYLAISTPGIAYMLIKGGEVTMASIASMMAAPVMSAPTHAEAASSLETQKIANQTGKSFGQVEMQYNAAGQAKLNAMVFQAGANKHGYNTLETAGMGSFDKGVASGLGDKKVVDKFGINTMANAHANLEAGKFGSGSLPGGMDRYHDMGMKGQDQSFALTEGKHIGSGGNMEALKTAEAIKTKFDTDYHSRQLAQEMKTYSANQWVLAKTTMTAERLGAINGMIEKGRNVFGMQGDEYSVLQQMSNYTARGGVVDEAMAKNINDKFFGGQEAIKAGMRVDAGIADGKTYLTAASQDESGSVELRDGRLIEKGALRDADVSGYKFSGSYTKETSIADGKTLSTYTGIVNGKEGHLTVDASGKAVFAEGKGGHDFDQRAVNKETVRQGKDVRIGDDITIGDKREKIDIDRTVTDHTTKEEYGHSKKTYDEDVTIIDRGTKIGHDTAFQMAIKGDQALVRPVTNQFLSDKQHEAEILALSGTLGKAWGTFMQRQGVSADYAKGEAHLSVGAGGGLVFKAEAGAKGSVGGERWDKKTTDLMTQQADSLIRSTLTEAKQKGLDSNATRALLSSKIEDYSNVFYKEVQSHSPEKFGASSPGQAMTEMGKKVVNSAGIVKSPYHPDNKGK